MDLPTVMDGLRLDDVWVGMCIVEVQGPFIGHRATTGAVRCGLGVLSAHYCPRQYRHVRRLARVVNTVGTSAQAALGEGLCVAPYASPTAQVSQHFGTPPSTAMNAVQRKE